MTNKNIQFFNTLSGKLEPFQPMAPPEVKMYTCGPTVYDYAHIGNFRAFVFEDLLRRFLEFSGYKVKHVMNLTDVDDKTIAGANREKKRLEEFTEKYVQAFHEDMKTLNCLPPTIEPRATDKAEMKAMQDLIAKLVAKGRAYEKDGSVYYRVAAFEGYGKLSKKKLDKNIAGASQRVDLDEYDKEQVSDFVLWKGAKEGEPFWDSPWGKGRPGWHIECSAMSMRHLGESFDLHAGGEDLIFPHHENEIAQSEGATDVKPFVRAWLHCKFLLVNGEKMSKSKGNFYTLRDLLTKGYDPMAIRYALLSTHYRTPLNFTLEGLKKDEETIKHFDDCYEVCLNFKSWNKKEPKLLEGFICKDESEMKRRYEENVIVKPPGVKPPIKSLAKFLKEDCLNEIDSCLSNDLNASPALMNIFMATNQIFFRVQFRLLTIQCLESALIFFEQLDKLFGFDIASIIDIPSDILELVKHRFEVRSKIIKTDDKSLWKVSDELRDKIKNMGWLVKDGKLGQLSTVKKKRRVWDK